jgi:hypothetical protein
LRHPFCSPFAEYADYIDDISRDCRWHFATSQVRWKASTVSSKAKNFCLTTSSFDIETASFSAAFFVVFLIRRSWATLMNGM